MDNEIRSLLKVVGKGEKVPSNKVTIKVKEGYLAYKAGSNPTAKDRLYKPWNQNFHGLDIFVLNANGKSKMTLYMLQTTISCSHKELSFSNKEILTLLKDIDASKLSNIVIVYVVPYKNENFKIPSPINASTKLHKRATSTIGWPEPAIEGFVFDTSDADESSVSSSSGSN